MVNTYSFDEAKRKILEAYPGHKIVNAFELSKKYVFVLYPEGTNPKEKILLDAFYSVEKSNGFVSEFTPLLDMDEFKKASKNPILIN